MMPNALHNTTVALIGIALALAMIAGLRVVSYKLMYEDRVRETVYEILEVER